MNREIYYNFCQISTKVLRHCTVLITAYTVMYAVAFLAICCIGTGNSLEQYCHLANKYETILYNLSNTAGITYTYVSNTIN